MKRLGVPVVPVVVLVLVVLPGLAACATSQVAVPPPARAPGDAARGEVELEVEAERAARASLARTVQVLVDAGHSNRDREARLLDRVRELGFAARREPIDFWSPHENIVIDINPTSTTGKLVYLVAHYDKTSVTPLSIPNLFSNGALDEVTNLASFSEGATDNATGVAVVLETARRIARGNPRHRYRVLLAGQEEMGLRGSRAHVARMSASDVAATFYVVNIDTIGVSDRDNCVMRDVSDDALAHVVHQAARDLNAPLGDGAVPTAGTSDHAPFREWSVFHDVAFSALVNGPGCLVPQTSYGLKRPRRARTLVLSSCDVIDIGDDLAGLTLLPIGRLHGFRDRADAVDVVKLHDAVRVLSRAVMRLDEQ